MATCLISIGSNLGDPVARVNACVDLLRKHPRVYVTDVSELRRTKPVGGPPGQTDFLNAAARIETLLSPQDLLGELQRIENQLGRVREMRWGPRVIDLDLLLYDDVVLRTEDLELPHPRMAFRRFVVQPACEIAGDMLHPLIGWTVSQIAAHLDSAHNYIALTGIPGAGKTAVVRAVADRIPVNVLLSDLPASDDGDRSSDRRVEAEKAIVRQRKRLLKSVPAAQFTDATHRDQALFTLSDFWLEQSAAYVECLLEPAFQADLMLAVDALLLEVPRPKLLVVLEKSLVSVRRGEALESRDIDVLSQLQQRIVKRSQIPHRGPTLWLDAEDSAVVVDEIVAAIEAMQ